MMKKLLSRNRKTIYKVILITFIILFFITLLFFYNGTFIRILIFFLYKGSLLDTLLDLMVHINRYIDAINLNIENIMVEKFKVQFRLDNASAELVHQLTLLYISIKATILSIISKDIEMDIYYYDESAFLLDVIHE